MPTEDHDRTDRAGIPYPTAPAPYEPHEDMRRIAERVAEQIGAVPLTTVERDALEGDDLYDGRAVLVTDANPARLEVYDGSEWVALAPQAAVDALDAGDVGADPAGTAASEVSDHESASDPHSQYLDESDGDARYTLQVGGTIRGYVEPSDDPGASGTVTLDLSAHNVYDVTPTGTIDFAFSGLPSSGDSVSATIIVRNDSHAITWPAGTRFADGEAPELDGETWLVVVAVGSEVTVFESASAVA